MYFFYLQYIDLMALSSSENKKLVLRLKQSDQKAYEKIYRSFYNPLCKYLLNYTHNQSLAEDITQEVLIKLWTNRKKLATHTSLNPFLYKSAYFTFIDYYRKKKRINEKLESMRFELLHEVIEEEEQFLEQRLNKLRSAIDQLPGRCKEIFLLNKYEGYRYKEIATRLNISVKTVENQIGKAFVFLRKRLR